MVITWGASKAPIKVSASYQEVYSFGDVEGVQPFQQGTAGECAIRESAKAINKGAGSHVIRSHSIFATASGVVR